MIKPFFTFLGCICVVLLSAVLFMVVHPVWSATIPDEFTVISVRFKGVQHASIKQLRKTLAIQAPPRWKFWAARNQAIASDLEDDLLRIRQFYRTCGYYHAQVKYNIVARQKAKKEGQTTSLPGLSVVFEIQEGLPVIINKVDLQMPETLELQPLADLSVTVGKVFVEADYRKAKKELKRWLGNHGYPLAQIEGRVKIHLSQRRADITYEIDPDRQFRFGPVAIDQQGGQVKETVVRRALQFESGQRFSEDKVAASQRNLINTDMFQMAFIHMADPPPQGDMLPIQVKLKHKKSRQIGLGMGYGSEDGVRLKVAWTYRNAFKRAGKLTLSARRSDLLVKTQAEYVQPYVFDERTHFRSNGGWQRELLDSYTASKIFANAGWHRKLSKNWSGSLGYALEIADVENLELIDADERADFLNENKYLISAARLSLTCNTIDNDLYPSRGSVGSLTLETATSVLGSELAYYNPALDLTTHTAVLDSVILAAHIRYEAIDPVETTESIPIFKRLFLGGSNSVRGYGYQKLGPLDASGNPLGGQSAFSANLEVRFPIYQQWGGIVFIDAGAVDPEAYRITATDIRYTTGAGVRYQTPVGPLRLEFGYKLNPAGEDELPQGYEQDNWRIHFSIGQTF